MKQIAKLKDEARKFEQREEWEKAIQAYSEVLRLAESGDGTDIDLPLYNRVGDLYVRLGRSAEAVKYYEQAADKYAETGLYNNAIALCNKALRYDAGRVELLKKLGQFSASQGFFTDARRWYLEYCERMSKRGAIDQAFVALSELADLHDNPEIRELLARQLREHGRIEQAIDEFRRAYALRVAAGQTGEANEIRAEILALDPNADISAPAARAAAPAESGSSFTDDLPGFIDIESTDVGFDGPSEPSPLATGSIEVETPLPDYAAAESAPDAGRIDLEAPLGSAPVELDTEPLDLGIESTLGFEPPPAQAPEAESTDVLDLPTFDLDAFGTDLDGSSFNFSLTEPEQVEEPAAEPEEPESFEPLPGFEEFEAAAPEVEEPAELPLISPDEPARFSFDEAGLATPETTAAPAEPSWLEEFEDQPAPAQAALPELEPEPEPEPLPVLEFEPAAPPAPEPEPEPLFEEPVFEAAPQEPTFEEPVYEEPAFEEPAFEEPVPIRFEPEPAPAVRAPQPPAQPAVSATSEYFDLSSFLEEDKASDSTRFVIAEAAPTGDEERDFADMLKQFKAKVAETIPKEDAGSHYDLGLAFKEMGLLDEAIAEFQTALRGGQEKLKVLEELGNCFVQKQQYSVAVTVLNRALQMPHEDESELLGVYYNLGRAHEELGQHAEARSAYERVISVDIGFQDTSERLAKL